jgi:hypothetical protein
MFVLSEGNVSSAHDANFEVSFPVPTTAPRIVRLSSFRNNEFALAEVSLALEAISAWSVPAKDRKSTTLVPLMP